MKELRRTILECLVIAAVGLCIGLTTNAVSPRGLRVLVNHFPAKAPLATRPVVGDTQPANATQPAVASEAASDRTLREKGLQPIHFADVAAAYSDPLYGAGMYMIIDARNDEHYADGHIPGAYQLDHYYADKYLPQVLPIVTAPQTLKVIVYCNGGDCEDSELAAFNLLQNGADPTRVYVYTGGITEWRAKGMPIEKGARGSGQLTGGQGVATPGVGK